MEEEQQEEDLRSAYSEARTVKQTILNMVGYVLFDLETYEKGLARKSIGSSKFVNWKTSLITLYRFMKPKLIPYKNENKYKESRDKIEPVMDIIMGDITKNISYEEQRQVTEDLIQFIDIMGITNLEIDKGGDSYL